MREGENCLAEAYFVVIRNLTPSGNSKSCPEPPNFSMSVGSTVVATICYRCWYCTGCRYAGPQLEYVFEVHSFGVDELEG